MSLRSFPSDWLPCFMFTKVVWQLVNKWRAIGGGGGVVYNDDVECFVKGLESAKEQL